MSNFSLTVLGSSGALPANGRYTSAQHLSIHNQQLLIDCGEGSQHQLRRYDIGLHKINHVFISHLHGDHYLGLTGLLFSMHLLRREHDLHLYSFRGLEEILLAQLKHARSALNFKVVLHPLSDTQTVRLLDNEHVTVDSFPLDHKIPTCGFLVREKPPLRSLDKSKPLGEIPLPYLARLKQGEDVADELTGKVYRSGDYTLPPRAPRSYAYCSDTQPSADVAKAVAGVNLLYHEATFLEDEKSKARETRHSTAAEAAQVAKQAGVKKLLLGHFSARYKDLNILMAEAVSIFPNTTLAVEGETIELTD